MVYRVPGANGQKKTLLDGVSLQINPGSVVGLTGPSGIGKSTLGAVMAGLAIPDSGEVTCDGLAVKNVRSRRNPARGLIGMIAQSPRLSFDPRIRIGRSIAFSAAAGADVDALMARCALTPDLLNRFPAQVSDGQLQRAATVRTLAARPRYIVCDEVSAMLDAATAAAIVNVLREQAQTGVGILMISHDHPLLNACADEVIDFSALL
ncbi:hypothetical protein CAQU_08205 [Corynebacterium aquilae DSM 44791]|uniref:ABC transporter domain-containing protein n=1 Tax=Corynebacterium aquilae DSM 44791 TaxID=1431546 RepID=A0A1L7CGT9_9CORY|nr:hypothetical protein CAQU_08205 [Corynebacterium aquilae DSM 44791]